MSNENGSERGKRGRRPEGQLIERKSSKGVTYYARFTINGNRRQIRIGSTAEGWTRAAAEDELSVIAAGLRRGHAPAPTIDTIEEPVEAPSFHVFASEWFEARRDEWAPTTQGGYLNILREHLLPFFADYRLDEITVEAVDRYREAQVAEARIAHGYINKTISILGQILDVADERELIPRNPVRVNPRNRRIRNVKRPKTIYLDRPEHIIALLDAAGQLDREAREDRRALNRRALIATLTFGGVRIEEGLSLRWRDVDLANGRVTVAGTKTDAADRSFVMLPALRDELLAHKATTRFGEPDDLVFCTNTGAANDRTHTLSRVLRPAIALANTQLTDAGYVPIPIGEGRNKSLTQHGLRHTHISLRAALGHDPARIARDVGHADLSTTFRIYTHVMDLDDASRANLSKLVNGEPLDESKRHKKAPSPDSVILDTRKIQRARQDSNLRPPAPEAGALSTELRAQRP